MASTFELDLIPSIEKLKATCRTLAVVEAILEPFGTDRFYYYDANWKQGLECAQMRNGSGDHFNIVFSRFGALIIGFSHESEMSPYRKDPPSVWPGIYDRLPDCFMEILSDPALMSDDVTFCIWRFADDSSWAIGPVDFPAGNDPDGSSELLTLIEGIPQVIEEWFLNCYNQEILSSFIDRLSTNGSISISEVRNLNSEIDLGAFETEVSQIGIELVK